MGKWITILIGIGLLARANVDTAPKPQNPGAVFNRILVAASGGIQEAASRRSFKLKPMNDSLEKTALAVRSMSGLFRRANQGKTAGEIPGSEAHARQLLDEARQAYPENSFAILLQAILSNAAGNMIQANQFFEEYLQKSKTHCEFDRAFIKWGEFHTLRRIVYELLRSRGVKFEGREKEIQAVVPYAEFIRFLTHPASEDRVMNLFFITVTLGGAVLLVFASLARMDFIRFPGFSLLVFYMAAWLAYGCWIVDLAFGLPFHLRRVETNFFFLGGGLFLAAWEGYLYWKELHGPLAPGYKRCPHCREVIVSLSVECFNCRKPV